MRKQHKNQASNPDHNLPLRPTSPRNPKSAYRFTRHDHSVSSVTGVWLQPSVSTIVASASGAIVAPYLSAGHARLTVVVSYILLGMGFMPAVLIMGMYFHRLAVYKVSFLPCRILDTNPAVIRNLTARPSDTFPP